MGYDIFYCSNCGHPIVYDPVLRKIQHYIILSGGRPVFTARCRIQGCACEAPEKPEAPPETPIPHDL